MADFHAIYSTHLTWSNRGEGKTVACFGADFLLSTFVLLEEASKIIDKVAKFKATAISLNCREEHPPALLRLKKIHKAYEELYKSDGENEQRAEKMVENSIFPHQILFRLWSKQEQYLTQYLEDLGSQLNELYFNIGGNENV